MAILDLHRSDVQTDIEGGVEFSFSKDAVSKLFQMMSNYMYSDKEYAVVSELAANAVDAHAMIDKRSIPIRVQLPSKLEGEFVVRDFGPGMSEPDVYKFLTQYGESSKGNTNDQIGSWGVGSKSPAAVSDSWSVISHHAGKRMHFEVFITEAGIPTLKKIFEGDTDETGVEVRVPVSTTGHEAWRSAALRAFKYYEVKPEFNTNLQFSKIDYAFKGNGWARRTTGSGGNLLVTMREYRLEFLKVMANIPMDSPARTLFAGSFEQFDFMFGVGEVSLSISREQLQYDKKTLDAIATRINSTFSEVKALIEKDLEAASNSLDYRARVLEWHNKGFPASFIAHVVNGKYGIKSIPGDVQYIRADVDAFAGMTAVHRQQAKRVDDRFHCWSSNVIGASARYDHKSQKYDKSISLSIHYLNKVHVVIRDVRDAASRVRHSGVYGDYYLILDNNPFSSEVKTVLASSFDKPEKQVKDARGDLTDCYVMDGNRFLKLEQKYYDDYLKNDNIVAIKIENATSTSNTPEVNSPEIQFFIRQGWKIIGFKNEKPKAFKTPKEALHFMFDKMKQDAELLKAIAEMNIKDMFSQVGANQAGRVAVMCGADSPKWNDEVKPFKEIISHFKKHGTITVGGSSSNFNTWKRVCEMLDKPMQVSGLVNLKPTLESIEQKYPMLKHLSVAWYLGSSFDWSAVRDYIKLVDEKI